MLGFRKMQAHSSLRVLSLGEKNRCAPEALASPAKVLATSKLGTLNMYGITSYFPTLVEGVKANQHLKVLSLSRDNLVDKELEDFTTVSKLYLTILTWDASLNLGTSTTVSRN